MQRRTALPVRGSDLQANADVPQNGSAFARMTSLSNYYPSNSEPEIALMCEQGHLWMQGPVNGPKSQPQQQPLQTLLGQLSYRKLKPRHRQPTIPTPPTLNPPAPSPPSPAPPASTLPCPRCRLSWNYCGHSFYIGTMPCKEPGSASIQFLCTPVVDKRAGSFEQKHSIPPGPGTSSGNYRVRCGPISIAIIAL